jgi:hypothetical protein
MTCHNCLVLTDYATSCGIYTWIATGGRPHLSRKSDISQIDSGTMCNRWAVSPKTQKSVGGYSRRFRFLPSTL